MNVDMTASSDDDVISIFKKLSGEDEIEIVGDEIHMNISEPGEYIVKLNDKGPEMGGNLGGELDIDGDDDLDMGDDDLDMGDDDSNVDYEIDLDDEEGEDEEGLEGDEEEEEGNPFGDEEEEEGEPEEGLEENIANVNGKAGQGHRYAPEAHKGYNKSSVDGKKLEESKISKKVLTETKQKYNNLLTEAKKIQTEAIKLKRENEEFRQALKEFRNKLVETVVFNSNLTYVTRILMEHSTTKAEKQHIIKRFDEEVSNLIESKNLYKSIVNELGSRKPITESIEHKIIKEGTTSSSKLNQSTAYVDPTTKRIIELMNKVK